MRQICINFNNLFYSVIIRDKVRSFGEFDDKTLYENESDFHTKIAFSDNNTH